MRWLRSGLIIIIINLSLFGVNAGNGGKNFETLVEPLAADEMLVNANRTGEKVKGWTDFNRSISGQNVHSNFLKNTNSCASCHKSHTGGGAGLSFQSSGYYTCMSCHDGSLPGTYNVLDGIAMSGFPAAAGVFSEERFNADSSVSFHLASGIRKHRDAPGAMYTRRGELVDGDWDRKFTCASCHGPHSTYSARHLHYNPNGCAERVTADLEEVPDKPGVYQVDRLLIPWLYYDMDEQPAWAVRLYDAGGQEIMEGFEVNYAEGMVRMDGSGVPASVAFTRPVIVAMHIQNHYGSEGYSPGASETVTHVSGVVAFCTSCHVAYYDEPEENIAFTWHNSFYHPIGMDITGRAQIGEDAMAALALERQDDENRVTCLTCHFAHGTDRTRLLRRGPEWGGTGELLPLPAEASVSETKHLRFMDPVGYGGRFEVCYMCHGDFSLLEGLTFPANGQDEVALDAQVEIFFNLPVYAASLAGNFMLNRTVDGDVYGVPGSFELPVPSNFELPMPRSVRFIPEEPFLAGAEYFIELKAPGGHFSGVRSILGCPLPLDYTFRFYTR